jgi:hypothetical protein
MTTVATVNIAGRNMVTRAYWCSILLQYGYVMADHSGGAV